ncbi:hypothetical protein [Nocardioides sp. Kera G14]|uniref:hypothetical protein n=1 Tax=Nocardioides sp. Kera G14 TaxID=2884264 RepID=UPI001D12D1E9|nr:hypothetical protein [Nocardioides sp. Kera G14]UDY23771.1 hypothetical protein LH076_00290 [Nocardioides sp. Kera G14]
MWTVASLIVVAVILAMVPQGPRIAQKLSYEVCQVLTLGQGGCTPPATTAEDHKPTEPCVTDQGGTNVDLGVDIVFVTLKDGRRVQIQHMSDGTVRVQVTEGGGAGVTAGVGAGFSVTVNDTTVGANADASASASLTFNSGKVYYTDEAGLDHLMTQIVQDQVKGVVSDTVPVVGGVLGWASDHVGLTDPLPDPDEWYAEGGVSAEASAELTGGPLSLQGGVDVAGVLGVRHGKDGSTTVYLKNHVAGQAGIQVVGNGEGGSVEAQGSAATGSADVITAVTFDSKWNMTEVSTNSLASGTGQGYLAQLFGGSPTNSWSTSNGLATSYTATLPIRSDEDRMTAAQYLAMTGVSGLGNWVNPWTDSAINPLQQGFMDAAGDRGTITKQQFSLDQSTNFGLNVGLGAIAEGGGSLSVTSDSMKSQAAQYWDGSQWVDWQGCGA